jgi:uncharacterized protein (DUF2252 family)
VATNAFQNVAAAERHAAGRELRRQVPRSSHATWEPQADRDPLRVLRDQELDRIPELIEIRHQRMADSPFAFLRGAAAAMADDLSRTPSTGLRVQACGDAHLLNFGVFASPERQLVFDINDFDETLPAPFEWDLKRLAASFVVAGRSRGFAPSACLDTARRAVRTYREQMANFSAMSHLDVWYARIEVADLLAHMRRAEARKLKSNLLSKARQATNLGALDRLTKLVDGQPRIVDRPPLVEHLPMRKRESAIVARYVRSLPDERRTLLARYRIADWARKVVGVGSVGTDDGIVVLFGDRTTDPLFLQVKEAQRSVLEQYAGASSYPDHGRRVVEGQRLMQAASDIFLGWTRLEKRDYYVRQLRDMKASVPIEKLSVTELSRYARVCGAALARAHARSGDPVAIAAYLGNGDVFDRAVTKFACAYADQTERDHAEMAEALRAGAL